MIVRMYTYIHIYNIIWDKECTPTLFVPYVVEDGNNDPTLFTPYVSTGDKECIPTLFVSIHVGECR